MSLFETTVTNIELEDLRSKLDEAIFKFKTRPGISDGYFQCTQQQALTVANAQLRKWKKENRSRISLFDRFAKIERLVVQQDHFRVRMPRAFDAEPYL